MWWYLSVTPILQDVEARESLEVQSQFRLQNETLAQKEKEWEMAQ